MSDLSMYRQDIRTTEFFFFFLLKVLEVDLIYFHYVHVAWKIFPSKLQKSGHTVEHELYIPHG